MIHTYLYQKNELKKDITRAEMLSALKDKHSLLWVDMVDPTDFESESLVEIFNFHPLAIEDCLSDHSEPKLDDYEEYLFLVMHAVNMIKNEDIGEEELTTSEVNIFVGKNYVVTFHNSAIKTIDDVKELARRRPDSYMGSGADKLLHAILDHMVDHYQPLIHLYDEKIDKLEEEIFNRPSADYLSVLMQVKQDIFHLRRFIAPQRDTINYLTRDHDFIQEHNMMYFRDVYDHLHRLYRICEGFHETLNSILQCYFSYSSHKLNEAVKHMTVLATLSMPVVVVASVYGMNFANMPELDWKFGYLFAIGLMFTISASVLIWMKVKKWL